MGEVDIIRALSNGVNQSGLRNYNERLILSVLQRRGQLAAGEIARRTHLSAQTISVILRKLQGDGLIIRGDPVKGKVGKPFLPVGINPDGALAIGVKLGRRGCDLFLTNLEGAVLFEKRIQYDSALPDTFFAFLRDALQAALDYIGAKRSAKICGIGIALPFEIWRWRDNAKQHEHHFDMWQDVDFQAEISAFSELPVFMINDATSACWAEHVYGRGKEFQDYAYFFISTFIGGGVVINQNVYEGSRGNAGALGSLRVSDPQGRMRQLVDVASIHVLEEMMRSAGYDPKSLWERPQDWSDFQDVVRPWLKNVADEVTEACLSACAVIDFEAIIIDGSFPDEIRSTLVEQIRTNLKDLDSRGLILPRIEAGSIGGEARAIGAACGPIYAQYFMNSKARMIG